MSAYFLKHHPNFKSGKMLIDQPTVDEKPTNSMNTTTQESAPPLTTKKSNKPPFPPFPIIDLNKIKGHTCSAIPTFKLLRHEVPNLSGTYYKTEYKTGKPDFIPYSPKHAEPPIQFHFEIIDGVKKSVPILNFADRSGRLINADFDPIKNTFTISITVRFYPSRLIEVSTGDELEFESAVHGHADPTISFIRREKTPELVKFIEDKEKIMNTMLNKDGYYFAPKNCTISGGCTCKVAIILKVKYEFTDLVPPVDSSRDDLVYLLPLAKRQDAKHWSEYESIKHTTISYPKPIFKDGSVISGDPIKTTEYLLEDTVSTFAHESSHLFGFPDEYYAKGGAVHKMYVGANKYIDVTKTQPENDWKMDYQGNLMSTPEYGQLPKLPSYYYAEFLKIFEQQSRLEWEIKKI